MQHFIQVPSSVPLLLSSFLLGTRLGAYFLKNFQPRKLMGIGDGEGGGGGVAY